MPMRAHVIRTVLALGVVAGMAGSAFACAYHDQQAAAQAQQQTAQAQQQTPTSTQ